MPPEAQETSLAAARTHLADVVNAAAIRGQITYLTNRGRRVAAIVPVPIAEQAEHTFGEPEARHHA